MVHFMETRTMEGPVSGDNYQDYGTRFGVERKSGVSTVSLKTLLVLVSASRPPCSGAGDLFLGYTKKSR